MRCPNCEGEELLRVPTREGVEADRCPKCGGVWLDRDELFRFSADPEGLRREIRENIGRAKEIPYRSPKTGSPMASVPLFRGHMNIDVCPDTGGVWLDRGEIEKLYTKRKRRGLLFRRRPAI